MDINLSVLIDTALNHYDECSHKYKDYIESDNIILDRATTTIKFVDINNTVFKYNILGTFDNETNIWLWAWMLPSILMDESVFVKKLLNYGLKIDKTMQNLSYDKLYLKTLFVNSRFLLENIFQLELQLAISLYLGKDNLKFIYPRIKYLSNDKKKFLTIYYLIM